MSSLSSKETEFLSKIAEKGLSIFTIEQAKKLWSPPERTPDVLYKLTKKGWLRRIERGVYLLIPLEAGPTRTWTENGFVIAQHLVTPGAIAYWSALHYWGMTEQIPNVVFVQTPRRKSPVDMGGIKFRFITVIAGHFYGIKSVEYAGKEIRVTDREKTLIDCAARPDLSGGIRQLAESLQANSNQINWARLDEYLLKWGGGVVAKRLGYLVEALQLPGQEDRLERWQKLVSRGISLLEPGSGNVGAILTHWQIRINENIAKVGNQP